MQHAYGPAVELPFTGLKVPRGVAVDGAGNLYAATNKQVVKVAAGSSTGVVLPFTGLDEPGRMAVDAAGNLYVINLFNDQIVKLPAGSSTQAVLPINKNKIEAEVAGVAVDAAGNVYLTEDHRVMRLAPGSSTPTFLWTSADHRFACDLAADTAGNLYFIECNDYDENRVWKLPVQ